MSIRNLLKLDNKTIELDKEVIDMADLLILEKKDFMVIYEGGCFGGKHEIKWFDLSFPTDLH